MKKTYNHCFIRKNLIILYKLYLPFIKKSPLGKQEAFLGEGNIKLFFIKIHTVYVISNKMHVYPITGTLKRTVIRAVPNLT